MESVSDTELQRKTDQLEQHRAGRDFWATLNEFLDEFYAAGDEQEHAPNRNPC